MLSGSQNDVFSPRYVSDLGNNNDYAIYITVSPKDPDPQIPSG